MEDNDIKRFLYPLLLTFLIAGQFFLFYKTGSNDQRIDDIEGRRELDAKLHGMQIKFKLTYYLDKGESASGYRISSRDSGRVSAVDPTCWSMGQVFFLESIGYVVAVDTGRLVKGCDRLDIYLSDREEASMLKDMELWGVPLDMNESRD